MPKKSRRSDAAVKRWQKGQKSRKTSQSQSNHPLRLKQWDNEAMMRAMEAVRTGKMGINQAARANAQLT